MPSLLEAQGTELSSPITLFDRQTQEERASIRSRVGTKMLYHPFQLLSLIATSTSLVLIIAFQDEEWPPNPAAYGILESSHTKIRNTANFFWPAATVGSCMPTLLLMGACLRVGSVSRASFSVSMSHGLSEEMLSFLDSETSRLTRMETVQWVVCIAYLCVTWAVFRSMLDGWARTQFTVLDKLMLLKMGVTLCLLSFVRLGGMAAVVRREREKSPLFFRSLFRRLSCVLLLQTFLLLYGVILTSRLHAVSVPPAAFGGHFFIGLDDRRCFPVCPEWCSINVNLTYIAKYCSRKPLLPLSTPSIGDMDCSSAPDFPTPSLVQKSFYDSAYSACLSASFDSVLVTHFGSGLLVGTNALLFSVFFELVLRRLRASSSPRSHLMFWAASSLVAGCNAFYAALLLNAPASPSVPGQAVSHWSNAFLVPLFRVVLVNLCGWFLVLAAVALPLLPNPASFASDMLPYRHDVFISYRVSADKGLVRRLRDKLVARGVSVWLDEKEIRGGAAWKQEFVEGLRESSLFLPVLSAASLSSLSASSPSPLTPSSPCDNFFLELRLAMEWDKKIFPLFAGHEGEGDVRTASPPSGSASPSSAPSAPSAPSSPDFCEEAIPSVEQEVASILRRRGSSASPPSPGLHSPLSSRLSSFRQRESSPSVVGGASPSVCVSWLKKRQGFVMEGGAEAALEAVASKVADVVRKS